MENLKIRIEGTSKYFSLLGSPHFTENIEIAQVFTGQEDAENATEIYIDSDEGYEKFGMIFTEIV